MQVQGERSVRIAAPPQQVWDVVSDVTRTGQWSPECFRVDWLDAHDPARGAQVGARFRGCNRLRFVGVWCSRCTITVCEPASELTWVVGDDATDPNSRWSFTMTPDGAGTILTQRWSMLREPRIVLAYYWLTRRAAALQVGSRQSLDRITMLVESGAAVLPTGGDSTPHDVGHHPRFARAWLRLAPAMEASGTAEHRRELLADLRGRVCEVGAGAGSNFAHYPGAVSSVLAVEPDPMLRAAATVAAGAVMSARPDLSIEVVAGTAEQISAPDNSFDVVVACMVLCSVPDQHLALTQMRRVLRPGGTLAVYEHVRSTNRVLARLQDAVVPGWSRLAGGCHPNRDTMRAVADAGFIVTRQQDMTFPSSLPGLPHVLAFAERA